MKNKWLQFSLLLLLVVFLLVIFYMFNSKKTPISNDLGNIIETWSQLQDFDNNFESNKIKTNSWINTLKDVERP